MIKIFIATLCFVAISGCSMKKCCCAQHEGCGDKAKAHSCSHEHKDGKSCGSGSCGK